jgi:glycosyltransferase involved in cell wall biosynthesis
VHLAVAGAFPEGTEEQEFRERIDRDDLRGRVTLKGFVNGAAKSALLRESDCLCFPSYYHAESFGLVVVEAMACGMAVVTSRWRALPSLLPPDYPGIVSARDCHSIAAKLIDAMREDATPLRAWYLSHFTEAVHLHHLREALLKVAPDA